MESSARAHLVERPPLPCCPRPSSPSTRSLAATGWPSFPHRATAPAQLRRPLTAAVTPLLRTTTPFQVGVDGLDRHRRTATRAHLVQARDVQEGRVVLLSTTICIEFQAVLMRTSQGMIWPCSQQCRWQPWSTVWPGEQQCRRQSCPMGVRISQAQNSAGARWCRRPMG
jgi:hypothetical protein